VSNPGDDALHVRVSKGCKERQEQDIPDDSGCLLQDSITGKTVRDVHKISLSGGNSR